MVPTIWGQLIDLVLPFNFMEDYITSGLIIITMNTLDTIISLLIDQGQTQSLTFDSNLTLFVKYSGVG